MNSGKTQAARGKANEGGFTLIEVVVAFVLLALVLGVGFEVFSSGLRRAADLEDQSRALVVAQSMLAAAGTEQKFAEGETRGESEDRRLRWTVSTRRSDEGMGDPSKPMNSAYQLFRVDVRVVWTAADGRERALALSTLGLGSRV